MDMDVNMDDYEYGRELHTILEATVCCQLSCTDLAALQKPNQSTAIL